MSKKKEKLYRIKITHEKTNFKKRDKQFSQLCKKSFKIFKVKNREYDDAIADTGVLGASVELIGVVSRLKGLVLKNKTHGRNKGPQILNVAKDVHNYANILNMMLEDGNWEGV